MFHHKKSIIDEEEIATRRLETLVDGVFAIAMTLLVLDIRLPEAAEMVNSHDLLLQLLVLAPKFFSFIISFVILGTFWAGHHTEFQYIKKLDHTLIWFNIFYLLFVSFLPFSASLLGKYTFNQTAVVVYGANLMMLVAIHYGMWQHARHHKNLIKENIDKRIDKLVDILGSFAMLAYGLAIVLSFWYLEASLIIYLLVPLPYIFGWIYRLV